MTGPKQLNISSLRDAFQHAIRLSTSLWYGTSDVVKPGKTMLFHASGVNPEWALIHPDDVDKLPPGARHLRKWRPTTDEIDVLFCELLETTWNQGFLHETEDDQITWVMRAGGINLYRRK